MTKLKNCEGDKTQKPKLGWHWNQVLAKLKNSKLDKTVTKLNNSNCEKTQQRRSGQNSKTITVTKL